MSQDNLFNNNNNNSNNSNAPNQFQPSPFSALYPNDIAMQFAATVPHRTSPQQSPQVPMNFNQSPFQNQDSLVQQQFMPAYPGSPYERPDSGNTRQAQTKAERRAEHNAIERARRESLNVKFQQLALTLPNLQNDTRPSKSTIIDRTLDFVKSAIAKEERYQRRIQELEKFNSYLLSQSEQRVIQKKRSKKSANSKNVPEMIQQQPIHTHHHSDSSSDEEEEEEEQEDTELKQEQKQQQQQTLFIPPTTTSNNNHHTTTICNSSNNSITSVTGVHNPNQLINSVSQSSVNLMPKSYNPAWTTPSPITTTTDANYVTFFQPSLITPKFQNMSKLEHPQDHFLLQQHSNTNNYILNTKTDQNFHHLMHRR